MAIGTRSIFGRTFPRPCHVCRDYRDRTRRWTQRANARESPPTLAKKYAPHSLHREHLSLRLPLDYASNSTRIPQRQNDSIGKRFVRSGSSEDNPVQHSLFPASCHSDALALGAHHLADNRDALLAAPTQDSANSIPFWMAADASHHRHQGGLLV